VWREGVIVRRNSVALALAGALVLVAGAAGAAPITVSFTGVVTMLTDDDGLLDGSVSVGTPYSGTFSYDPALLSDSEPSPSFGTYEIDASTFFSLSLSVGSYTITFDPNATGTITMANNAGTVPQDQYTLTLDEVAGFESLPGTLTGTFLQLLLRDLSQTALSSDALTGVPYTDVAWNSRRLQLGAEIDSEAFVDIEGTVTFVPESGTLLLLGAAVAALVLARRR
jgi:hypothetical protein